MKKIEALAISIVISVSLVTILVLIDRPTIFKLGRFNCNGTVTITESNEAIPTTGFDKVTIKVNPGYFTSVTKLRITRYSPYSDFLANDSIEISLGNDEEWVRIPIHSSVPNDIRELREIGFVNLNEIRIPLYMRCTFSTVIDTPPNVTRREIEDSAIMFFGIEPILTSREYYFILLLFVSFLGTCYTIIISFLNKTETKSE